MASTIRNRWIEQDKRVIEFESTLLIPEKDLSNVPYVQVKEPKDLEEIPREGGCYWIWTNEPVNHKFHKGDIPESFDGGVVIYNGIAKDNVRARIYHHLFGVEEQGWSGISMDILKFTPQSHAKKAMSTKKRSKVAILVDGTRITDIALLLKLHLSDEEKEIVRYKLHSEVFFRNGIDRTEAKHKPYDFKVYYISGLKSVSYLEFIEKIWREKYNLPQLCSYKSGR